MRRFAEGTQVSSMRTLEQIQRVLIENGATDIATGQRPGQAAIAFTLGERRVRFILPLPSIDDFATRALRGRRVKRSSGEQAMAWETACREKWRALLFSIKAKLVSAQSGVETLEEAFLANIMTTGGGTVWDQVRANAGYLAQAKALPPGDAAS